jgi:hypothetical protein
LNLKIYKNGASDSDTIPVTVGNVHKYDLNKDYQLDTSTPEADLKKVAAPTFTGKLCDNFALEVHFKVMFQPVKDSKTTSYEVTEVIADIVFGKFEPELATDAVSITRKTSLTYMEDKYSR